MTVLTRSNIRQGLLPLPNHFIDALGRTEFIDQNSITQFVDQNGIQLGV